MAGLHEYFHWCEDMGLEPVLAVYSGYSLDGTSITGDALIPFVQDALDELEVRHLSYGVTSWT